VSRPARPLVAPFGGLERLARSAASDEGPARRYRALFDVLPDPVLVTDLAGQIRDANRAAEQLLGLGAADLTRKPLSVFVALGDRSSFRSAVREAAGQRVELSVRLEPRSGEPVVVELRASRLGEEALLLWVAHHEPPG
jgi:PAS domain S-box-containing protein